MPEPCRHVNYFAFLFLIACHQCYSFSIVPARPGPILCRTSFRCRHGALYGVRKQTASSSDESIQELSVNTLSIEPATAATSNSPHNHKKATGNAVVSRKTAIQSSLLLASMMLPGAANARETMYPDINFNEGEVDRQVMRKTNIDSKKRRQQSRMETLQTTSAFSIFLRSPRDFAGALVWGSGLWFLSGSRSNPLINPLANLCYNAEYEPWLKDRNEGLFSPVPLPLLLVAIALFFVFGILTEKIVLLLVEGDSILCLQLAGVLLLNGIFFEIGRIASDDKAQNREETERDEMLQAEFVEFAERRIKTGGNCHRSEVVTSFRRYFGKYRNADNSNPLNDLEIERLCRNYVKSIGINDMTSAGFFKGIQLNKDADLTLRV